MGTNETPELEHLPVCFKSVVWEQFVFPVSYVSKGERERAVDETRHYFTAVEYVNGNTSNMFGHI